MYANETIRWHNARNYYANQISGKPMLQTFISIIIIIELIETDKCTLIEKSANCAKWQ